VDPVAPGGGRRRRPGDRRAELPRDRLGLLVRRGGDLGQDGGQEVEVALGRVRDAQAEAALRHRHEARRDDLDPRDLRLEAQRLALARHAELQRHRIARARLGVGLDEDPARREVEDHAREALTGHDDPAGQAPPGALRHPSHGMRSPSHGLRPPTKPP
jgi:hypothetical protein